MKGKQRVQARISLDQLGTRDLIQALVKCIDGVTDRPAQPAAIHQRTGVFATETLCERHIRFEKPENRADIDFVRRQSQLHAAISSAKGIDQTVLGKEPHHLSEMILGCVAGCGNVALAHCIVMVYRAEHQGSDRKICSRCKSHWAPAPFHPNLHHDAPGRLIRIKPIALFEVVS
jgi:hypothetical protein